ncbi:MAG: carbohydrate kinase family protein [Treponema sp.]|jgi:sugar/nucleoside kinase (ribokinase family)|nr:carbohydrate kinase family protein [Treponema sp.]
MERGICVAGNIVVDNIYTVRGLPKNGELTTIQDNIRRSTGGALCNVISDLAIIDYSLPLIALGRVGSDPEGDYVLDTLKMHRNIDLSSIKREGKTAFTAVMEDEISKERTFFHYRGANATFCEDDINWDKINSAFLHIGYILVLDALDEEDDEYGTKMARLLCHAKERGIKTSIDVVSEAGNRFKRLVPPALKYTDYCIINEVEAEHITGITLRDKKGNLIKKHIQPALEAIKKCGVSEWAVIHCPEGGYGFDSKGCYAQSSAIPVPPQAIKGKVGAGDAFCAGAIYAASQKESLETGLELGNAAAAASLLMPGAVEGMKSKDELKKLRAAFG